MARGIVLLFYRFSKITPNGDGNENSKKIMGQLFKWSLAIV